MLSLAERGGDWDWDYILYLCFVFCSPTAHRPAAEILKLYYLLQTIYTEIRNASTSSSLQEKNQDRDRMIEHIQIKEDIRKELGRREDEGELQ